MVEPVKSYWNAMDKGALSEYFVSAGDLGIPTPPFEKQLDALKGRIYLGATNVELGFMGTKKGSVQGGNITPEMHSKVEREEMRELAKLNKVALTTHASANVIGLAGLSRDGTFNPAEREHSVLEIKRAIDFAADVAQGGPVVVHAGEFSRPIYGTEQGRDKEKFEAYPLEKEKLTHPIVDDRTGKVFEGVREDETIVIPRSLKDEKGNIVPRIGPEGKPLTIKNEKTGKEEVVPLYETHKVTGEIMVDVLKYEDFKKKVMKEEGLTEKEVPLRFFNEQRQRDMEQAAGQADEYEVHYRNAKNALDELVKLQKVYKELEGKASKEGLERLKQKAESEAQHFLRIAGAHYSALAADDFKTPGELLDKAVWTASKNLSYGMEIATGSRRQLAKYREMIQDAKLIDDYAIDKTADSLARLGKYAYDKEKKMKLEKPLFIAAENVFPEQYGSHPDELKRLVQESRKKMADILKKNGVGEREARTAAEDHIKATFDVGHVNTWKKYFTGTDEQFKTWILDKTKELMKEGIIGHIHISDNFGYEDEHLAPGEGNAPIREFVEELKKQGYGGKFIIEAGAQDKGRAWEVLTAAMRNFNSPIYEIDGEATGWAGMEHGYFGYVRAGPKYIVGAYAPDIDIPAENRTWTFWSGMPME